MRILIAEDDENSRVLLETALTARGHAVSSANDGADAMAQIQKNQPDLIISDILMPKLDGFELCRQVKSNEQLKDIPVVFYTATYIEAKDKQYAMSLGASRFIVKPMEIISFLKIIDEVIDERKANKLPIPKQVSTSCKYLDEIHTERITEKLTKKINQLKKEQRALQESMDYNRLLFDQSPIGLALCRMNGELVDVNPAFSRIVGCTVKKALTLNYWSIGSKGMEITQKLLERLEQTGRYGPDETEYKLENSDLVTVQISGMLLHKNGETFILSTIEDIIHRKKSEDELHRYREHLEEQVADRTVALVAANKELETFSYSVSHDLRAPLRAICGFSESLLEEQNDCLDDNGKADLQRILKAGKRMGELIEALLRLSQIFRCKMHIKTVNLTAIAKDIGAQLQEETPAKRVIFKVQKDVMSQGDEPLLRVALNNLISNAWKYSRKESEPEVEFGKISQEDGNEHIYYIKDNGIGLDMQYAKKLFMPFQRLDSAHEFEGTGIGLATVERIFHRHHGKVWVESKVGEGAIFYFTLDKTL